MIRKTTAADLPLLMEIYDTARQFMRANGNPTQWAGGYPSRDVIEADIEKGISYCVEGEDGQVHGTFMFYVGEEPTYHKIYEGQWLNDKPYGVIHRVASDGQVKGLVGQITAYCSQFADNLRIDTHRDNLPMQGAVEKEGFTRCGIIYLASGDERLAYHRN